MGSFFQVLPLLVFLFVVISVIRGVVKMAKTLQGSDPASRKSPADFDPEEAGRTRRIQEEIRRKIAERRGGLQHWPQRTDNETPPELAPIPAGAPTQLEHAESTAAILERQENLAEQMRALEVARAMTQRKTAEVTALKKDQGAKIAAAAALRAAVVADLRDASSARRAILLREILGTPVGLR
ncbi:MAG: hypothetical protein JWM88_982 [Verrucomicrobia bacterium]|nr:hypothetical protein [Verrucomicrobiota bacterium]